jgi:hypothetical protein
MTGTCILPEYCALLVNRNDNLQSHHEACPEENKYAVLTAPTENRVLIFHPTVGLFTDRLGIASYRCTVCKYTEIDIRVHLTTLL